MVRSDPGPIYALHIQRAEIRLFRERIDHAHAGVGRIHRALVFYIRAVPTPTGHAVHEPRRVLGRQQDSSISAYPTDQAGASIPRAIRHQPAT